ncbi:MAG: SEL1-like repeat protein [Candidatus Methanomethylophilaceae archaeon]|nr:SEL1-like repeat protein [Candidatus Methanomethylophilaceae archaeon]
MYIDDTIMLGKFDSFSSSIQRDFDSIIKEEKINDLVTDLLENYDPEEDYSSDSIAGEVEYDTSDTKPRSVSEDDLIYINDLNSSQEQVLSAIRKMDRLVVQGPPGTGKSQTIASLICDFVNRGKTVLMVSEKKTALDVVYSRLGNVSKYTMMLDDVGDKAGFFGQLSNMFSLPMSHTAPSDLSHINKEIDSKIKYLEELADRLYAPDAFGIEPYKLYEMGIDTKDPVGNNVLGSLRGNNSNLLFNLTFEQLSESKNVFDSTRLVMDAEQYCEYVRRCHYLPKYPENIDDYSLQSMRSALDGVNSDIATWKNKGFLSRFFGKKKTIKSAHTSISKYFPHDADEITNLFMNGTTDELYRGFDVYRDFNRVKPVYNRLSDGERVYLNSLLSVKPICQGSIPMANNELYQQTLRWHLDDFQSQNQDLYATIAQFDDIINQISRLIDKKKNNTIGRTTSMLEKALYENIIMAKRSGDIRRTAEKKTRMSVSTFVNRYGYELFRGIKVWLMTPEVVSEITPLETGLFDLVVFDEASQMFVEKGIPSILRAKKVIIAGDSKQLRPNKTFMGRMELDDDDEDYEFGDNAALEEESLLDLAKARYRDILLNFHYRSKYEELIAFSNYAFYRGRLYVSPNKSVPPRPPIQVHMVEGALWSNQTNLKEAETVIDLLKAFFRDRRENETVGIITFNKKQTDLIWDLIDKESAVDSQFNQLVRAEMDRKSEGNEDIGLFVRNIENVQGDERDVIIFSIGYAKNVDGKLINQFGSLSQKGGENRLNVAISRAKKHIDIAMSFEPQELNVSNSKNDGPKMLKKYLEYSCAISNGNDDLAKQILHSFGDTGALETVRFDSPFEEQVYEALREQGLDVASQVGIGGYSIDLAVRKKGQYILGIECDGRLYHSSVSARERDYHRQKYLESRGWRIHRIWSPNWWKNPQGEVQKIMELVNSFTPAHVEEGYIKHHEPVQYVDTTAKDYEFNVVEDGREKTSGHAKKRSEMPPITPVNEAIVNTPPNDGSKGIPDQESDFVQLQSLADRGDVQSMYKLGLLYDMGGPDAKPDVFFAKTWYWKAAEAGHTGAMVNLAKLLMSDRVRPKDPAQAKALLKRASMLGDRKAKTVMDELFGKNS